MRDPFPSFTYLTLTQLGQVLGLRPQQVNQRLVKLGLRTSSKRPTQRALDAGFAKLFEPDDGQNPFFVWAKNKTVALLHSATSPAHTAVERRAIVGPFVARRSGEDGDGFEIVGDDGLVSVWVRGQGLAERLAELMNLAHRFGKFP